MGMVRGESSAGGRRRPEPPAGERDARREPAWRSIRELVRHGAEAYGDREFFRFPEGSLTFAEVYERSNRLAHILIDRGVRPGERVAIMLENGLDWPVAWFAILRAGAVAVPVNVRYRRSDLAHVLRDSAAALVVTSGEQVDLVRSTGATAAVLTVPMAAGGPATEPAVEPYRIANFQYTSGTTGFPKACMLSHDYWLRTAWLHAALVELRDDDVMLMAQAFSYVDPQWAALMCLMGGRPLVVLPRFSASGFWPAVREHGATLTYVLGAMPLLLYKQPPGPLDRDNRVRLVMCSGIIPELHRRFEERWGAPWRELYGSTESGPDLMVPLAAAETVGTGALGRPPAGKRVRIVDERGEPVPDGEIGEIVISGRPMMEGYWNHPESTAHALRGGWYHSGDLGYRDSAGWIHHSGRLKDMIRRGGENISAAEVENVLSRHPAVAAVALVPVPDPLFGELPKAFVQLSPGHRADTETAVRLLDHARRHLAPFKVPALLEFVAGFPMTPSARIRKRELLDPGRDQRTGAFDATANSWIT